MGNLTILTVAFDPKQEERKCFSNGDYRPNRVSNSDSAPVFGSERVVAYPDRTAFWGDYFRLAGQPPETRKVGFPRSLFSMNA
jgi:hypothetical protein